MNTYCTFLRMYVPCEICSWNKKLHFMIKNLTQKKVNLSFSLFSNFWTFECKQRLIIIVDVSNNEYTIYSDIVHMSYIILSILLHFYIIVSNFIILTVISANLLAVVSAFTPAFAPTIVSIISSTLFPSLFLSFVYQCFRIIPASTYTNK